MADKRFLYVALHTEPSGACGRKLKIAAVNVRYRTECALDELDTSNHSIDHDN